MNRTLLALVSGIILALAWPSYGFPILLFFAFVPLLMAERELRLSEVKRKGLQLFGLSYLAFFIWNIITTSWLRHADIFGASFAVFVNSGLMALLMLLYHKYAKRQSQNRALLFLVALWISFEKLHLEWEFSWPWLNLGNGFSEYITWIQWYEYTGTFGGTLWVWLLNILIFKGILSYQKERSKARLKSLLLKSSLLILFPILISLSIYYSYSHEGEKINVIALQPNIDPYSEKYAATNIKFSDLFIELSNTKITDSTDFIVAPETFFAESTYINRFDNSLLKNRLERYVSQHPNINLITGISFVDFFKDPKRIRKETNTYKYQPNTWYDDYNSAIFINTSDSVAKYHKSKLVVGVENFPYQGILKPLIGDAMIDLGGTVAMKTTQNYRGVFTSSNSKFKVGPIICYESVYGEFVTGYIRNDANFLAIITNDAWWNETQGHKQHLSYARLRAVETRRDIVRSANTGISAIINAKGDITTQLGYNQKGALSGQLISNDKITFYVLAGDYIARISIFVLVFVFLIGFFRRQRETL
ncbi:Apolipoprotein N-acyltransferase [Formosa sp. Hel1_31_208]|uniref:apolipoprotein N-acyltransferase n=1 Tax=Formosa sp. Hel1_31_208 TaxID=1798225 RepID=UPI000879AF9A|nr:apolipoprotein N-acyltransferase [Formosa sp. Hel1_31_208]SDS68196.1 Apolipoprotein N-acyltransferase [Formosa sp. Hel1_31_208]